MSCSCITKFSIEYRKVPKVTTGARYFRNFAVCGNQNPQPTPEGPGERDLAPRETWPPGGRVEGTADTSDYLEVIFSTLRKKNIILNMVSKIVFIIEPILQKWFLFSFSVIKWLVFSDVKIDMHRIY